MTRLHRNCISCILITARCSPSVFWWFLLLCYTPRRPKKESASLLSDNRLLYREVVGVWGSLVQIRTLKIDDNATRYSYMNGTFVNAPKINVEIFFLGKKWGLRNLQRDSSRVFLWIHFVNSFIAFQIKALLRPFVCNCGTIYSGSSPFQKLHILCVFDETRPHHDRLKTLSVDGPQLHIC